ncbi:dihydrodipicolinate synthase family protein [Caldicoprobacter algeriensis]|uniref:dihydrodipicolinate synthase family protein n=1 Tax=Caldicoprobacter algeriensis TaxID=699281 RepID=UPI0020797CEC|nr:dihydrodipicolinate synthase family protein [Caldicoprobacter algeriensis]MCM8900194.1 dihydrodipicolinate synthase family protein [Caldicoprobacter algeriensis]
MMLSYGKVWPTMITPFTNDNKIDYKALEDLIEWYIDHNVDGLFAVCGSSEMFHLSLRERVNIASFVKEKVCGRVPVIASGHVSESIDDQIEELKRMVDTGIDALILISNRLARQEDDDNVWKKNTELILKEITDIPLGIYECPYPYKRLLSPELLKWCAATQRFFLMKDTSCDLELLSAKCKAVSGSNLKIYNANTATLVKSMEFGVAGYMGVMANFHPDLYVSLMDNIQSKDTKLKKLESFLSLASLIESQCYPISAKYYLRLEGLAINLDTRSRSLNDFTPEMKLQVEYLYNLTMEYRQEFLALKG